MTGFLDGFERGMEIRRKWNEDDKKEAIGKVGKEKEVEAYTLDQGKELEALASAKDADGNAYYQLDAQDDGKYRVTPTFKNNTGDAPEDYKSSTIAAKGVSFLGKNYDAPLNDSQKGIARQKAIGGIMEQYGDAEGAQRYAQSAKQSELMDSQLKQSQSQDRQTVRAEEMQAKTDTVRSKVAEYTQKFTAGPDGKMRDLSNDDHLHLGQYQASELMKAGMVDEASKLASQNMQFTANKIQTETAVRDQSLGLATAAAAQGDFSGIQNFYNKFVPDGAQTSNIVKGKDGKVVVSRTGIDGEKLPDHTFKDVNELLAATQSISKPEALTNYSHNAFSQEMQRKQAQLSQAGLGLQGRQLKLTEDERTRVNTEREAGKTASVNLAVENNPSATPAHIGAVRAGIIPAIANKKDTKVEASEVVNLLSDPAIGEDGKQVKNMMTGKVELNRNKPKEQEFFKFMKKNGIKDTNEGLLKFLSEDAPQPVKPKDASDAMTQAKAAVKAGVSMTAVNAQLKEWGYAPFN